MTSNQPYLIRAYYEWIIDNELTPHLAVDATVDGVEVPMEHVKDGQIVLNVAPSACADMQMSNEWIMFNARFGGVSRKLIVPVDAVIAIFARENGVGTVFMQEEQDMQQEDAELEDTPVSQPEPTLQGVPSNNVEDDKENTSASASKPPAKGKPTLKVVK
ncbi:ClpXP protease specificity-enhancing factor [Alteromonas sp. a30]|uniref:ClpXP protease specificity-enhancing factor n=1 Tax=Alteromonas sp. a30 TaxID=2730917 RepID=UPI00227EAD8B|nr:ClpXP protease specificity-enhancing factor [Alteromonas sp. a30]MCY7294802.1 ClpXP protease specificity-enhancing factor [Alteromonas sp. a30]